MKVPHLPVPEVHALYHLAADVVAGTTGAGWIAASYFDLIHGVEMVVSGGLVIFLLILRVRSHLRRDAAERRMGRQ